MLPVKNTSVSLIFQVKISKIKLGQRYFNTARTKKAFVRAFHTYDHRRIAEMNFLE